MSNENDHYKIGVADGKESMREEHAVLKHLLVILMEECAEVSARASKAFRFGPYQTQVSLDRTNLERLDEEVQDLLALLQMIRDVSTRTWFGQPKLEMIEAKIRKVMRYMSDDRNMDKLDLEYLHGIKNTDCEFCGVKEGMNHRVQCPRYVLPGPSPKGLL